MNAKIEFLEHVGTRDILCAKVSKYDDLHKGLLKSGFSKDEYKQFLSKLDFDYDNSYGYQELYGAIWYKDGTWSSRRDNAGSEWWYYNECPKIPEELK